MFDFIAADLTCAQMAGIDTTYLRKSNDGTQCVVHREFTDPTNLNALMMMVLMSGKPFSFGSLADFQALMLTANWVGTEEPAQPEITE